MLSIVPCSEAECIYQKEGICTLDTVSTSCNKDIENHDCMYYKNVQAPNSENQ